MSNTKTSRRAPLTHLLRWTGLALLIALAVTGSATASEYEFTCPAFDTIRQINIPHSMNCAYSAKSDGVGFGGYDMCGLTGLNLDFHSARISTINGYWSLYCMYSNRSAHLTLAVGPNPDIRLCDLGAGRLTCTESRTSCKFECPENPNFQDGGRHRHVEEGGKK